MDAGPVWATREFPLPDVPRPPRAVCIAIRSPKRPCSACWRPSPSLRRGSCRPEPSPMTSRDVRGCLRPVMRQSDRAIAWSRDPNRHRRAEDRRRRQRARRAGQPVRRLRITSTEPIRKIGCSGTPGQILAQRDGAICRATVDGAVWITHLKAKDHGPIRRNEAACGACPRAAREQTSKLRAAARRLGRAIGRFREIRYVEQEAVGYLHFDFYNGAMSTDQCRRLRDALLFARRRPTRVIVLLGGRRFLLQRHPPERH